MHSGSRILMKLATFCIIFRARYNIVILLFIYIPGDEVITDRDSGANEQTKQGITVYMPA